MGGGGLVKEGCGGSVGALQTRAVARAAQTWLAVVDRVTVGGRVPTPPVLAAAEGAPRVQGGTGRLGGRLNTALSGKCKGCCARQQRQRWQEVRHWFQQLGLLCLFEEKKNVLLLGLHCRCGFRFVVSQ